MCNIIIYYMEIYAGSLKTTLTMETNNWVMLVLMPVLRRQKSLLLLVLLISCSAQSTYYVTPTPDTPCPGEPCHTLSQYVAGQDFKNLLASTTTKFLPGNHTLKQTISVTNLTSLTLHGDSSSLPEVTSRIVCTWPAGFVFTDITELHISALAFISCGHNYSAAVRIMSVQQSNISNCSFYNNGYVDMYDSRSRFAYQGGGALYMWDSNVILIRNVFQNNSAMFGGVVYIVGGTLTLTDNIFQNNSAMADGGVLYVVDSTLTFTDNTFLNNYAKNGGVFSVRNSTINATGNTFQSNTAEVGGVIDVSYSTIKATSNAFQNNTAYIGGVLGVRNSTINATGNTFQNNTADDGGVIDVSYSTINATGNAFQNNTAYIGGVLDVWHSTIKATGNTFQNNTADVGGVLSINNSTINLVRNIFQKNLCTILGGTIFARWYSIVRIYGNNILEHSRAKYGGGIAVLNSQLELGNTIIKSCTANYGGGLYVHNTQITGSVTLTNNSAIDGGGGMYASSSTIHFTGNSTVINNSAIDGNGGGLLLSGESQFYLRPNTHVNFISNSAKNFGGAIKVEERNPLTYCIDSTPYHHSSSNSDCFFQLQSINLEKTFHYSEVKTKIDELKIGIYFDNNSAEAGADLYGGSVDNCAVSSIALDSCFGCHTSTVFDKIIISENTPDISSDPLYICTCRDNRKDCTGSYHPEPVYPGGMLEVSVIAHGQRNGPTPAVIQIISTPNSNITFQENENIQKVKSICTSIKYTIQSFEENTLQSLTLHAQGPCPPTLSNTFRIPVKILQCPSGFQLSDTEPICICTERLQRFTNSCQVDNRTIHRKQYAQFWVGYNNKSEGVILHPHCPFDYCTSEETHLAVVDSDKQCNYNRSGLLCGRCSDNLSLAFGSSHCLKCSNSYLSLLIAFAFAGMALVFLLLVLRLTVVAGTINGLIFYANVVAVNSATFFQPQATNFPTTLIAKVLTVFIAWLNLDLGIKVCFYNGMDAYVKTWLQFAFPLYVWALVGMIIIGSHYLGRVAKMFGSNPVAVLATLFLLSYAKLLRTVIAVLSYTSLEYPNNSPIAVWLYDGNIRYLSGKHIPLFMVAMLYLVFLFFPYMMLLIFGQWLQAKSKFKIISWINSPKVKPFLDTYHAPYTVKHRYWTGLMLLLRFVLFLISAVNALGDPSVNLLAIASTTIVILTRSTILSQIYKTWSLGLLETSFILNLSILAVATLYIRLNGGNQNAATFTSVGIAFATFIGIVIYHFVQQIKGTRLWRRLYLKHDYHLTDMALGPVDPPDAVFVSGTAPTQTVVDICYHELREPCMATD